MQCPHCFCEVNTGGVCPFCGYDPASTAGKFPLALKPGSILNGRYILGHVLGQGGFGITYIAWDDPTKERVAIKEYFPAEFAGRTGVSVQVHSANHAENFAYGKEQFLEEAKTLAAFIGNAGIVRIYSYFEENGTAYLSMEYVDGLPLDKYMWAEALLADGKKQKAWSAFKALGGYRDAAARAARIAEDMRHANSVPIAAGIYHTVGLKKDGTVESVGYDTSGQCDVSAWTDIVSVAAGASHTVGLKTDGTVIAAGSNGSGQCEVSDWTNIVSVSASNTHTVGLKADGTVGAVGSNGFGQSQVSDWTGVVAVAAGRYYTVGLRADGTVVAVGANDFGQCNVADWTEIVAVAAGTSHTVGLDKYGTVVAVGSNSDGQCKVTNWNKIGAPKL